MKTININDKVGFRVTKEGKEILKKHHYYGYEYYNKKGRDYCDKIWKEIETKIDNKEVIWKQMYDVMHIFGLYLTIEFNNPIETVILIKEEHIQNEANNTDS